MAKSVRGNGERGMCLSVVAAVGEEPAHVEDSAASFARMRAFRNEGYNF
jgi:hypothetical protein